MSKVTVVGAGNVGATCANYLTINEIASEVVVIDVKEGFAEGKAMDINQCAQLLGFNTKLIGVTNDWSTTAGSDVVVITSGAPRKPGMTREDLISINANIVSSVCANVVKASPNAIIIVVANPMDTMTYLTLKNTGLPKNKVIGMGGALDSSRFQFNLSKELGACPGDVSGIVIGGHGDTTMIPLMRIASCKGLSATSLLSAEKQEEVIANTMKGGAILTGLLGTSAWYAPGAAAADVVKAILFDQKKVIASCVYLDGEYGQKDICIGVPVVIGKGGCEKILDYKLDAKEQDLFDKSAAAVRSMNDVLVEMKLI